MIRNGSARRARSSRPRATSGHAALGHTAALLALAGSLGAQQLDFAKVDARLSRIVAAETVPGLSLVVVTREGGVVHEATAGTGDLDVALRIASATKVAGATVTMVLVDRERLTLDDPVSRHLGAFPSPIPTIAQCLSCTSGLGTRGAFRMRRAESLETSVAAIAQAARFPRRGTPGTAFHYGGAGFQVAGRVAEVAAGRPFAELFDELVARPLGMTTWTWARGDANPDLGGGGRCSVRDYAKLVALHLGDGAVGDVRVLSEAAARAMRVDRRGDAEVVSTPYDEAAGYGLGWWILPAAEPDAAPTVFADPGAFGATPWIDVARGYGAVLFLHGTDPERPPLRGFRIAKGFWLDVIGDVAAVFDAARRGERAAAGD